MRQSRSVRFAVLFPGAGPAWAGEVKGDVDERLTWRAQGRYFRHTDVGGRIVNEILS